LSPAGIAAETRALLGENLVRHRLAPDLSSDASKWSSKTGTLLNLRHEVGVVEHEDGSVFAVAALTESEVPAAIQPAAEAVMGEVARGLPRPAPQSLTCRAAASDQRSSGNVAGSGLAVAAGRPEAASVKPMSRYRNADIVGSCGDPQPGRKVPFDRLVSAYRDPTPELPNCAGHRGITR
jgi:hypothetical protein